LKSQKESSTFGNFILKFFSCNEEHEPIISLPTSSPKFHKLSDHISKGIGILPKLGCELEEAQLAI
jgi:hypothetical protein